MRRLSSYQMAACAALLIIVALSMPEARGEGIRLFTEFEYRYSDSDITEKSTGRLTEERSYAFDQLYSLDITKTVYPYLEVRGGGVFELDEQKTTTEGVDTRIEERTTRPFLGIDLDNPLYSGSFTYRETEIKEKVTGLPDEKNFRDEYAGTLAWRPVELPIVNFRYTWTHSYDSPRTIDTVEKLLGVDTLYDAPGGFDFRYAYTRDETEQRADDFETLFQAHEGRVNYSRALSERRLGVELGYRILYDTNEFSGAGSGLVPLIRSSGLFSLDATPADGPALQSLPSLIDGNLTTSTGINIGLNGDRSTLTNIGLDFGFSVSVDTLFLWVDRRLPSTVSDSFSWDIYVSPDNNDQSTWTLHATLFPAPFGTFQDRFEISFPPVTTRFIKVVTRPLSPTVIGSSGFPDIFVTEMEGFTTISGQADRITETDQTFTCDLRWRPRDGTSLGYSFFYRLQEIEPSSVRTSRMTNSVSASHAFSEIFSFRSRVLREDSRDEGEEREGYTFSAALTGDYLETFSQTLAYSGTSISEEEGKTRENSLVLSNRADLYEGWSAFLDTGYSWDRLPEDNRQNTIFIRTGTNMIPNDVITLTLNYTVSFDERTDEGVESSQTNQTFDADLLLVPLETLSLFARLTYVDEEDSSRSFQSYSANWSPFPDGTLQLFLSYIETISSGTDIEDRERSITPGLRWDVARNVFLEASYSITERNTLLERRDTDTLLANLTITL